MPWISHALMAVGYAAIVGGLVAAAAILATLDGMLALAAAVASAFAGFYAGFMAIGFAANLRILSAVLDRIGEEPPQR